jgi:HlyD family secretion protein
MKKAIIIIAVIIVITIIIFINPFKSSKANNDSAIRVSTAVVHRGNLIVSISSTGIVEPIHTVELKSKASGEIIEFPLDEGDRIKKGQLIVRLDPTTVQNEYDQAAADLEVAKVALSQAIKQADRQKQMFDQGMISELDYENVLLAREQANSGLIKANITLSDAKERLSDTEIESPIDGIILQKNVEEGQIIASGISAVSGGTAIAMVADLAKVYVRASVDEVDIGQIQVGQKATVIAESYPDREFQGEIIRIHPQAIMEQNVTTFDVTIEIDNSQGLLMAGMNASVEIIAGFKENILLVPREALTDARSIYRMIGGAASHSSNNSGGTPRTGGSQRDGAYRTGGQPRGGNLNMPENTNPTKMVIVVNNGQQEPVQVEIGLSNFEQAEIISGANEGDTVLTTVTSKALADREEFLERMRSRTQLPGMGGR